MQVPESRMIASVGFRIRGSGRCSTRTSPGAYMTTPRIEISLNSGSSYRKPGLGRLWESLVKGVLTGHPNPPQCRRTVKGMDNRVEVREFLISRRAKITPQQAGLPDVGTRRVPGLRRGGRRARRGEHRV